MSCGDRFTDKDQAYQAFLNLLVEERLKAASRRQLRDLTKTSGPGAAIQPAWSRALAAYRGISGSLTPIRVIAGDEFSKSLRRVHGQETVDGG